MSQTWRPNVYVVDHPFSAYVGITQRIFSAKVEYNLVKDIDSADIVVWTGGEDINPAIYGEEKLPNVYVNYKRDVHDIRAIDQSAGKKFLVGICRGAQLLNCYPNSGKLWQHVDCHSGNHLIYDKILDKKVEVNSYHHQMMKPTDKGNVIAYAENLATQKIGKAEQWFNSETRGAGHEDSYDPEVIWYDKTKSLLVQFHPEFGHRGTTDYFFDLMDRYFFEKEAKREVA